MPMRICVIGGGAAGLGVLKTLNDADEIKNGDWVVTAFEKRDDIGGVWYPSPPIGNPPATPLYDALTTNISHISMAFPSFSFKPSTPLYPSAEVVLEYLRDYAKHFDIRKFVRFQSIVEECIWNKKDRSWTVHVSVPESTTSRRVRIYEFDKVIVANGHYAIPRYPSVPGLSDWLNPSSAQREPRAFHSVYYRNAAPYKGQQAVLVIGGGPSGRDIVSEMCRVVRVVYHSATDAVPSSTLVGNCTLITRGRVKVFHENGTVSFDDEKADERSIKLDHAILATGYEMHFPFLKSPILHAKKFLSDSNTFPPKLMNTTYSVYPLTRHILPITEPVADAGSPWHADRSSLAFIGLPIRVAPFPLFEIQSRYLLSFYRNPNDFSFSREKGWFNDRCNCLKEQFHIQDAIVKKMHVFTHGAEQYTYAAELLHLAGVPEDCELYPEPWALEIYEARDILRRIWLMLERDGKAEEVVRGVGSAPGRAGREEWVAFARNLIKEYGSKV